MTNNWSTSDNCAKADGESRQIKGEIYLNGARTQQDTIEAAVLAQSALASN